MTYRDSLRVMRVVDTWFRDTRHKCLDVVFANKCALQMSCKTSQEVSNTLGNNCLYTLCNMVYRTAQEYGKPLPKFYKILDDEEYRTYGSGDPLTVGDIGRWLGVSWLGRTR